MARNHGQILCSIWSDQDFIGLSADEQRMYFVLLSQRLLNHAGVVPMTLQKWANLSPDTTTDDVLRWLKGLACKRYVVFDPGTEELLVRSLIRNDGIAKQPQVLKAALRVALEVDSPLVRWALAEELRKLDMEQASRTADALFPKGSPTPPEPFAQPPVRTPAEGSAKGGPDLRGKGEGETSVEVSPPVGGPVSSRPQAKRGTRIPDDFTATPDMVSWARDNTPDVDGRKATESFMDYWRGKPGKDGVKLDWPATWRNWMRREQENAGRGRGGNGYRSATDANIAALLGAEPHLKALPGGAS